MARINLQNGAGNYSYQANSTHTPESLEQLQEIVSRASKIKALGSRHSFYVEAGLGQCAKGAAAD